MRSIAGLARLLLVLLSLCAGAAVAQELPDVRDPLFGVRIPAAQMQMERADEALLHDCGVGRPSIEQMSWIFAEANTQQGRFLALGGLARRVRHGRAEPWIQNWKGELVVLVGERCMQLRAPRQVLTAPEHSELRLSAEVLEALADDAVARLTRQFGSRAALVAALRAQAVYPTAGPPALRAALERPEP
jgi:hypothetical protein